MVNTSHGTIANDRLNSWKDIAAYLDRDVRTVIRWEENGLPVYRVPGGKRQAVFAYRAEIDAWMHGKSNTVVVDDAREDNGSAVAPSSTSSAVGGSFGRKTEFFKHLVLAVLVVSLLFGAVVAAFRYLQPGSSVQITKVTRLSRDGLFKTGLATDGANIYFGEYGHHFLRWQLPDGH
jgi:hypothetical protein